MDVDFDVPHLQGIRPRRSVDFPWLNSAEPLPQNGGSRSPQAVHVPIETLAKG